MSLVRKRPGLYVSAFPCASFQRGLSNAIKRNYVIAEDIDKMGSSVFTKQVTEKKYSLNGPQSTRTDQGNYDTRQLKWFLVRDVST